ncbi:Restriction endonuclease [Sporotomaculum syntrophicum]|uniref:Restriction endonuclease n=1 Tax=Sporotomaculum syntrophicum TaxID=182264 RepID=A0A9D2WQQ5_9FIRM|nr:restriction endonuclease [Sporotomaculum syntrophicum]KAF1085338.1 Restriction endonuclease [Sporotomaculum syntrophicum]
MQHPPRDERTRLARAVDFALTVLVTWLLTIIAAQYLPLGLTAAKVTVIVIMLMELIFITKVKVIRSKALDIHRDIWFSARKCRQNIYNIKDRGEFAQLIKQLLEGLAPFEKLINLNPGVNSTIDISGYLRNQKIGVMCLNLNGEEQRVHTEQIKGFLKEVKQAHLAKGIVITSGSFTEDARRFVRRMNGRVKIFLIDGYGLLHLAKRTQHPIFTMEKWEEERDIRMTGKEIALSIKENIITSKKRALLFTILGVVFIVIAALQTGLFSVIYLIFGVINLFIGLTGFIMRLLHKNELIFD